MSTTSTGSGSSFTGSYATRSAISSATATSTSTSSSSSSSNSSSSQPSSILFFIAVAIGVLIALVFIFFSMRYYVRTRLGIYATARITTTNNNGVVLLTGDFPMQTFNSYSPDLTNQLRQRRRRRKYTKKRRLTEDEVNHLFPVRTYQDWLEGGAERDIEGRDILDELKEENDEEILEVHNETDENLDQIGSSSNQLQTTETTLKTTISSSKDQDTEGTATRTITSDKSDKDQDIIATETTATTTNTNNTDVDSNIEADTHIHPHIHTNTAEESIVQSDHVDLGNPFNEEELHYDSGTCAICIDSFESDDLVRGLICGHVFHQDCLDPWLIKRKACCPMCKRDYYLKRTATDGEAPAEDDQMDTNSVNHYTTELQYTTLRERVDEILARDPSIEERAKASIEKYLGLKWRLFWFIMGISRTDLIYSAIVSEDQRTREAGNNNTTQTTETTGTTETNIVPPSSSNDPDEQNINQENDDQNDTSASNGRDRVERMV